MLVYHRERTRIAAQVQAVVAGAMNVSTDKDEQDAPDRGPQLAAAGLDEGRDEGVMRPTRLCAP
jgi:hypothetical protein